jgi:hypothetical protein
MITRALAVMALLAAGSGSAHAETRRVALIVGSNVGMGSQAPLHFAERDAQKIGEVFAQLGGVAAENLIVLRGRSLGEIRGAMAGITARLERWRVGGDAKTVLLFFYSGHSDGQALEIGSQRLSFAEIRRWLEATGANVRIAIVDSCRSGALLALKGATLGPTFDVRLADTIASNGEALLTSSAADESALESSEIGASFFSHHLVSGLRGAADVSGDGMVTLVEAYQYAFARTVSATADTTVGPQHPGYDYRLHGKGDLVLTQITRPSALVELPAGFDRVLVTDSRRPEVLVELGSHSARRLALAPGTYTFRSWRAGRRYLASIEARANETLVVTADRFRPADDASAAASKGDAISVATSSAATFPSSAGGLVWGVSAGLERSVSEEPLALAGVRLAVRPGGWWPEVAVSLASARGAAFRETRSALLAGYRWRRQGHRLTLHGGFELGAGLGLQSVDGARTLASGIGSAGLVAGVDLWVTRSTAASLLAAAPVAGLRKQGRTVPMLLPGLWLGVSWKR